MGRWWVALKATAFLLLATGAQAAGNCKLVVLGDSLTAGYGLAAGEGFPARLAQSLERQGQACEVIDAGVSGDTSAGGLARLDWVLADNPTHLLVELGANDGLRALPADQLHANLDAIVTRASEAGVNVMLAGMWAPPNLGPEYGEAFRSAFETVAKSHEVPLYPFFLDGVAGTQELVLPDGLHPTAAGVDEIVRRITPVVADWLKTSARSPD
jgi:acyl-CoA thioesterase-1